MKLHLMLSYVLSIFSISFGIEIILDAYSEKCSHDKPIYLSKNDKIKLRVNNFNFSKYSIKLEVSKTADDKETIFKKAQIFQMDALKSLDCRLGVEAFANTKILGYEENTSFSDLVKLLNFDSLTHINAFYKLVMKKSSRIIKKASGPVLIADQLLQEIKEFNVDDINLKTDLLFEKANSLLIEKCKNDTSCQLCKKDGDSYAYLKELKLTKDSIQNRLEELYQITECKYSDLKTITMDDDAVAMKIEVFFNDTSSCELPKIIIKRPRLSLVSSFGVSGLFKESYNPVEWKSVTDTSFVLEKKEKQFGLPTASINLLVQYNCDNFFDNLGFIFGVSTSESNKVQTGLCLNLGGLCFLGAVTAGSSDTKRLSLDLGKIYNSKIYENPNKTDIVWGYYFGIGYAFEYKKTDKKEYIMK